MSRRAPRLTVRIDRITIDRSGLDQRALAEALRKELGRTLTRSGPDGLGPSSNRPTVRSSLAAGDGSLASRVASTVSKAVRS